jgi:putative NADH-flavin reductase
VKLAILGATGGIGGHLLTWAIESGHEVQVLARDPGRLASWPGVRDGQLVVTRGDAHDGAAVAEVTSGTDAVLSALGPRGVKTPALLEHAAGCLLDGMAKSGTRRLICVSAAGAFITGDPDTGFLVKAILPRIFAGPFADTQQMEAAIRASDLDWTLVRPSRLVNTPLTGRYRVRPDYPPARGRKIGRADVAHFIAAALTEDNWLRAAPALGY